MCICLSLSLYIYIYKSNSNSTSNSTLMTSPSVKVSLNEFPSEPSQLQSGNSIRVKPRQRLIIMKPSGATISRRQRGTRPMSWDGVKSKRSLLTTPSSWLDGARADSIPPETGKPRMLLLIEIGFVMPSCQISTRQDVAAPPSIGFRTRSRTRYMVSLKSAVSSSVQTQRGGLASRSSVGQVTQGRAL